MMITETRKQYLHDYYEKHKKKFKQYFRSRYQSQKKSRLIKQQRYYKNNKKSILIKNKMRELTFKGHAQTIWRSVNKYAHRWKLPICKFDRLWEWTKDDPTYESLWNDWRNSGYTEYNSPVLMRGVKKQGWESQDNLRWDKKQNYSWWNEDAAIFKEVSADIEKDQREAYNKRSREWRKKIRLQFKEQQKLKEKK